MNQPPFKVLILCTGNSARSVMAEYLLRAQGQGRFDVHSAGARPTGRVNPLAVWVLKEQFGIDASDARSKSWDEFKAVKFDCVITVCDHAREACPVWPGRPAIAHWDSPDPAVVEGDEKLKKQFFVRVAGQIARRVDLICALSDENLDSAHIQRIGERYNFANDGQLTS
jgi:arsenate reductase